MNAGAVQTISSCTVQVRLQSLAVFRSLFGRCLFEVCRPSRHHLLCTNNSVRCTMNRFVYMFAGVGTPNKTMQWQSGSREKWIYDARSHIPLKPNRHRVHTLTRTCTRNCTFPATFLLLRIVAVLGALTTNNFCKISRKMSADTMCPRAEALSPFHCHSRIISCSRDVDCWDSRREVEVNDEPLKFDTNHQRR